MDRELLIQKLNDLSSSIPDDLVQNESKDIAAQNANDTFQNYYERLENYDLSTEEYDLLAHEREDLKVDILEAENIMIEENITKLNHQSRKLDHEIEEIERSLSLDLPPLRYNDSIPNYRNNPLTQREREAFSNRISRRKVEAEKLSRNKTELQSRLEKCRKMREEIESNLEHDKNRLENNNKELSETREKLIRLRESSKVKSGDVREKLENDTEALYRMVKYFNTNPKNEVDKLIQDIERGRVSETELQDRLQNINALISSRFYNADDKSRNIDLEEVMSRRSQAEQRRNELLEKTANDEAYLARSERYDEISSQCMQLENLISREEERKANIDLNYSRNVQELDNNKKIISQYDKFINDSNKRISSIQNIKNLSEESKSRQIENEKLKISSFESAKTLYESKNARLEENVKSIERDISLNDLSRQSYLKKLNKFKNELYSVNQSDKEKDLQEISELESVILSTYLEEGLAKNSCINKLDEIIEQTTGQKVNREEDHEEVLPSFVKNFTPEQRKMYDDFVNGMSKEEKKDLDDAYNHSFVEPKKEKSNDFHNPLDLVKHPKNDKKEELAMVPYDEESHTPFITPKKKVKAFKEPKKTLWNKVTDWVKNHKKLSIAAGILLTASVLALGIKGCNNKKADTSTPSPTPPAMSDTIKPVVTPKPTEKPVVTPTPTQKPEKTKKPSTDSGKGDGWGPAIPVVTPPVIGEVTPDPGIVPDPGVTPAPEVTPIVPPVVNDNEYILSKRPPGETKDTPEEEKKGSSRPADPTQGYVEGEAIYNPITNTFVDSTGASTTVHEDGTSTRKENTNPTEEVDENRNKITNPDMTPVEEEVSVVDLPIVTSEEDIPQDAKPLEEIKTDNSLPEAVVDEYEQEFDDAFAALEETENQGLGR